MIKIIIENKTSWSNKDLKSFLTLICKKEGYFPKKIEIVYGSRILKFSKDNLRIDIGGYAQLGYGWVKLLIPNSMLIYDKPVILGNIDRNVKSEKLKQLNGDIIKQMAKVFIHEIHHNRGLKHKEMVSLSNFNVDYISDFIIRRKSSENKQNNISIKYQKILKKIKEWEIKKKRANTYLKKYYKKKRYYEKRYPEQINF